MTLPTSCRQCGKPGRSVCDACQRLSEARRPSRRARGYDGQYDRNRRVVVDRALRDGHPCYRCGRPFASREQVTADHIIPLRFGGSSELCNLAPCCQRCNLGWRRKKRSA